MAGLADPPLFRDIDTTPELGGIIVITGPLVILILKIAVIAVTVLLIASLVAVATGRRRLHGRINIAFFVLTMTAVVGLEVLIRFVDPALFHYVFDDPALALRMRIHLCFSIPSAILMPVQLFSGLRRYRRLHLAVGSLFLVCWTGTFVTGVFFLPHEATGGPR